MAIVFCLQDLWEYIVFCQSLLYIFFRGIVVFDNGVTRYKPLRFEPRQIGGFLVGFSPCLPCLQIRDNSESVMSGKSEANAPWKSGSSSYDILHTSTVPDDFSTSRK